MKTFFEQHIVTIGDTNMEQNVYWLNYCAWFGSARELFLLEFLEPNLPEGVTVPQAMAQADLMIATTHVEMDMHKPAFFGERLTISINTRNFRAASVELICEIKRGEELIAKGKQVLVFMSMSKQKPVRMPDFIRQPAMEYLCEITPTVEALTLVHK